MSDFERHATPVSNKPQGGDQAALQAQAPSVTTEQAEGAVLADLEITDRGDIAVYLVWSLKPGQPQIIAICTSKKQTRRYAPYVREHHGGVFRVERAILNHAFGMNDTQSAIYAAAIAKGGAS